MLLASPSLGCYSHVATPRFVSVCPKSFWGTKLLSLILAKLLKKMHLRLSSPKQQAFADGFIFQSTPLYTELSGAISEMSKLERLSSNAFGALQQKVKY